MESLIRELGGRVQKLQALMEENNIEGALIQQNADLYYFTGDVPKALLYIPAEGKPLLLVKKDYHRVSRESLIENTAPLPNVRDLSSVLTGYGYMKPEVVGLELDVLPAAHYFRCRKLLAPAEIVNISGLINKIRMIKSDYEIGLLKKAAERNSLLFSRVKDFLHEGITEIELARHLEFFHRGQGHPGYLRLRGFNQEMAYGHVLSGSNLSIATYPDFPISGPGLDNSFPQGATLKKISVNEPVMIDYAGIYKGYMVDQTRFFCLGRLSEKFIRAYEAALSIQDEIKKQAGPGVTCESLYRLALRMAAEYGLKEHFMGYPEPVKFVGHGTGIEIDELPVIAGGFEIPLETGMVFALEPKFLFPDGAVGIENTFVVRETELETLTVFDESIQYL